MKYTFLLPAYKGRFLDEMLQSIQKQTYQDYKVVISDDCSPEDLRTICEPYLKDPRFTYRRNAENMGSKSLVFHWNLLIDMCDTEFLIMASDDDIYEPQFLEEIDKLVQKYPDVDLFRARVRRIDEQGCTLIKDGLFEEHVDQMHFIQQVFLPNQISCIANYCMKTASLKRLYGFMDFPLAWSSDRATTIKLSLLGCCNTADILLGFRQSDINISGRHIDADDAKLKVGAYFAFHHWFKDYFSELMIKKYPSEILFPQNLYQSIIAIRKAQIKEHMLFCRWKEFHRFAKQFQHEFSESYIVLLYHWLRIHL